MLRLLLSSSSSSLLLLPLLLLLLLLLLLILKKDKEESVKQVFKDTAINTGTKTPGCGDRLTRIFGGIRQ